MATTPKLIDGNLITDTDRLAVEDPGLAPAVTAIGTTVDTPFVGVENATARTGISLWKGVKNTLYDALGTAADAIVAVGAVGSISAKLRRVTQGLEDLKTLISIAAMPANTVATGSITTVDATGAPHTVPTAGSYVVITPPAGAGTVALHIVGTFTGQLEFEGSIDLVNYPSVQASNGLATVNAVAGIGPASMNAIFILPGGGYRAIRARASTAVTGTAVCTFVASIGTSASIQTGAQPAGANIIGKVDSAISTPTPYTITCAVADTQYGQALPANCRLFEWQARTEATVRWAFVTGKVAGSVADYRTLKAGDYYTSPVLMQTAAPSTLYVASSTAGTVVELLAWT